MKRNSSLGLWPSVGAALSLVAALTLGAPVASAEAPTTPQNVFFAVGGSPIYPAGSVLYSAPNISFGVSEATPPNPQYAILQARNAPSSPWTSAASVWFGAPTGLPLEVGTYLNAQRFADADSPMLWVSIDSGCNQTAGSFRVDEITRDASDHLLSFAATFVQYCETYVAPQNTIVGLVRYNSTVGWSAWTLTPRALTYPPMAVNQTAALTL